MRGVVALALSAREERALEAAMRQLQWGAGWLEVLLRRHGDPAEAARMRLAFVLQLVSILLERPALPEAAAALVTEAATRLGCDRVALGLVSGDGVRIEAVSHAVQFDRHANLLAATVSAMNEALDQGEPIVYPPDRDGRLVVTLSHAELAQISGAGGVATFPLLHDGRRIGALTLERAPGLRFDAPAVEALEALASLLGPLIELHRARQKSLRAHVAEAASGYWRKFAGPGHGGFKLAAGAAASLALFLSLASGTYRVSTTARIEGKVQRALSAPFAGYVRESSHRAGDVVAKGTVLARLDDRDLRLERVRLAAQREQLGKQLREAMAKRERAQARILGAQIEQVDAQLALIEEQLSRTEIVAPFDGVLVSGDLTQALGAPLERGQVLFEIAPLAGYRVALQVDERAIADVRVGQRGELVLAALPGERYPLAVSKITPVSAPKDGRNVFRVEAEFEAHSGARLRPGMEGVAKIEAGEAPLLWIGLRDVVNWLRLKWWASTP